MRQDLQLAEKIDGVQDLLRTKFGVRKRALPRMLQKVGRRLPKRMHRQAEVLLKAQPLAAHPKLSRQLDWGAIERAHAALVAHLEAINVAERRKDRLLKLSALVALYVIVVVTAFVWWMWWAGHV